MEDRRSPLSVLSETVFVFFVAEITSVPSCYFRLNFGAIAGCGSTKFREVSEGSSRPLFRPTSLQAEVNLT